MCSHPRKQAQTTYHAVLRATQRASCGIYIIIIMIINHIYIYIYTYIHTHIYTCHYIISCHDILYHIVLHYIYVSLYSARVTLIRIHAHRLRARSGEQTVGFHNFNLRIFNLRVSNPNKSIVDVFLTRCRISMCQGLGPKKHDEISEIDRTRRGRACPLRTTSLVASRVALGLLCRRCMSCGYSETLPVGKMGCDMSPAVLLRSILLSYCNDKTIDIGRNFGSRFLQGLRQKTWVVMNVRAHLRCSVVP